MDSSNDGSFEQQEHVSLSPVEFTNYECEINDGFNKYLKDAGFDGFGFNFNVVTILGSQSSGKSYLMNRLFESKFETMDATKGHSQTTKGIWASLLLPRGPNGNATVVFDSEGTDSRERGEARLTFEHRSSLFCLALSDVVVVNLWYNSLGNMTGSNYALLKTVVEANLELVASNNDQNFKTVLFFCVRDWSPLLSPLDVLKQYVLNNYMASIWNEINKPARFADAGVESLFEIRVFGLANALTDPASFQKDLALVKEEWNRVRPDKYSRLVPSDGFLVYSTNVWKTIIEQNHLDIPTQKEMLSSYRCSEIKNVVLDKFQNLFKEVNASEFNDYVSKLLSDAEEEYFSESARYDAGVARRLGVDLLTQLCEKLQPFFEAAMADLVKKFTVNSASLLDAEFAVSSGGRSLKVGDSSPNSVWPEFSKKSKEVLDSQLATFQQNLAKFDVAHNGKVPLNFEFDTQPLKEHLRVCVTSEVDMLRSRHLDLLHEQVSLLCDASFVLVKSHLMEKSLNTNDFWDYFDKLFGEMCKSCVELYEASYRGLVVGAAENEFEYLSTVLLLKRARESFEKMEHTLDQFVVDRFDRLFNYHEFKGELVPTEWQKQTELELNTRYKAAKEGALVLLDVFKAARSTDVPDFDHEAVKKNHHFYRALHDPVDASYVTPLSEELEARLTETVTKRLMDLYKKAQVVQTAGNSMNSWRNVPPAVWLMMVVLGWNEIRAAFRVLLRFQLLIPLLVVVYFGMNYVTRTYMGDTANSYVKLARDRTLKTVASSVTWAIKTAHSLKNMNKPPKNE